MALAVLVSAGVLGFLIYLSMKPTTLLVEETETGWILVEKPIQSTPTYVEVKSKKRRLYSIQEFEEKMLH